MHDGVVNGVVIELLPGGLCRVKLAAGNEVTAHAAEEFRRVSSPVKPGDRVRVRVADQDPKRGTIVGAGK